MDSNTQQIDSLYLDILPRATQKAFHRFIELPLMAKGGWYLAGGTALAMQVGHRRSVDLDFFTTSEAFNEKQFEQNLSKAGSWETTLLDRGTLYGNFEGAKVSFISYPYFSPSNEKLRVGKVSLILPLDVAVMKAMAISQRGRKRDFVDLYWLMTHNYSLVEIIKRYGEQYTLKQSTSHLLKSFVYFYDAEGDPMPRLFFKANWRTIKVYLRREVARITSDMIER